MASPQEMTETAHRLGMSESNFVNPNGLPADGQITSARDLAILARALIREFPAIQFLLARPGDPVWPARGAQLQSAARPLSGHRRHEDRLYLCSGFNLVATATRDNKQLIAVVLGAPSGAARAVKAAEMLESGFRRIRCPG